MNDFQFIRCLGCPFYDPDFECLADFDCLQRQDVKEDNEIN